MNTTQFTSDLLADLARSSARSLEYFYSIMNDGGGYEGANDLSCYYKLPMMFVSAGDAGSARKSLRFITDTFMKENGDFLTKPGMKSIKQEYIRYYTYINGWICRAANRLGEDSIVGIIHRYMEHFHNGDYVKTNDDSTNSDVLTVAHQGLINLELGKEVFAREAGEQLIRVFDKQGSLSTSFYLVFDQEENLVDSPDELSKPFYYVEKEKNDQLYFMLAYPVAFLAILADKLNDKRFLNLSECYMDYILTCKGNPLESRFSHKLAWAASLLFKYKREKKYLDVLGRIVEYFISIQDSRGMWFSSDGIETSLDQSAEIVCWFNEIRCNLI